MFNMRACLIKHMLATKFALMTGKRSICELRAIVSEYFGNLDSAEQIVQRQQGFAQLLKEQCTCANGGWHLRRRGGSAVTDGGNRGTDRGHGTGVRVFLCRWMCMPMDSIAVATVRGLLALHRRS